MKYLFQGLVKIWMRSQRIEILIHDKTAPVYVLLVIWVMPSYFVTLTVKSFLSLIIVWNIQYIIRRHIWNVHRKIYIRSMLKKTTRQDFNILNGGISPTAAKGPEKYEDSCSQWCINCHQIHTNWVIKTTKDIADANCYIISMDQCKTAVTPLLTHWSYCSLALSHRYNWYNIFIDTVLFILHHMNQQTGIGLHYAKIINTWWRHQKETFSALLALCVGNSPVTGELPAQRPVTWSFDVFFDLHIE